MKWYIILSITVLGIGATLVPSLFLDNYNKQFGIIIGLLTSILGLIIRLVYLINMRLSKRIEEDKLLASVRLNTEKNNRVENLVDILDKMKNSDQVINQNIHNRLVSTFDYANNALTSKTVTDKTEDTLLQLYQTFSGNIFILSKNEVCENFWCSNVGEKILDINLKSVGRRYAGLKGPKCHIERIFIQNSPPVGTVKEVIEKQIESKIKCFAVNESSIGEIRFCDAVIFENYAVCETQINNNKQPQEYKIYFQKSKLDEFKSLFDRVKNKSEKLN